MINMKKYHVLFTFLLAAPFSEAAQPVFNITPNVKGQEVLIKEQQGTYIYQITNNTNNTLNNIGLHNLPSGVSVVSNAGYQYCTFPLNLNKNASCLIKLNINSKQITNTISGGPEVCFTANRPVYCSQPLVVNQLATQVIPGPIPSSCNANSANFDYELTQRLDSTTIVPSTIESWGPGRNHLLLSPSNPDLRVCTTNNSANTTAVTWMQKRVLSAEEFWVKQKMNYCHHHVPDFYTPLTSYGLPRTSITTGGGYCSAQVDIKPGTFYYGQPVRWNYSGTGSETQANWINNNQMWYGVDCSDFTSFIYNFAFGIQFNSDTGYQAGQAEDGSQDNLTPNAQTALNELAAFNDSNPNSPAGVLVCKNGQTEREHPHCGGYGTNGYFSVFLNADLHPTPSNITPTMLTLLKPGDLLFLGFTGNDGNNPTSMVTHVITWTGKKVGYGSDDIRPEQIAPEEICPNNWQPQIGDWVIIDSHYQGPDYRVFSHCFYQNNIWGVRRVIGYMQSS
jgi:cell wall-associated NlpC family hydrolase